MKEFENSLKDYQTNWRLTHLPLIIGDGTQNGISKPYILPNRDYLQNFFPDIRDSLFEELEGYVKSKRVKPHTGIHNLMSSWVVCANMYWPFRNPDGFTLLASFLKEVTGLDIYEITEMDLEYEDDDNDFKPGKLLGEDDGGMRGSGQTSPDLAIKFTTKEGKIGIILIESKFSEHSFYSCSGYSKTKPGKPINDKKERCFNPSLIVDSDFKECHLTSWDRKYWDLLGREIDKEKFSLLKKCPMSSSCYQLFRQQALAKGLEKKYDISVSAVATDSRNEELKNSSIRNGMKPFPEGWRDLFPNLKLYWFSHNEWFNYVRGNNSNGIWNEWIEYIGVRYAY
jgi:hypothetical protein